MKDHTIYRNRLRKRLDELTGRMTRIEGRLDERPDPDPEERSVEREDDEVLDRLGQVAMTETARIRAALQRIENGTYGTCLTCGEGISEERLDLIPFATRCRHCALTVDT